MQPRVRRALALASAATILLILAFTRLQRRRLASTDETLSFSSADIVCLGDSLTAGYSKTLDARRRRSVTFHPYATALKERLGGSYHVLPLGFSGWTSDQLLAAADAKTSIATRIAHDRDIASVQRPGLALAIRTFHPKLVIIMAGTNDILKREQQHGKEIADRVWQLHKLAHDAGVRTIAIGIPNWSPMVDGSKETHEHRNTLRQQLNNALHDYAKSTPQMAKYIPSPLQFDLASPLWDRDGVHPTPEGYAKFGQSIAQDVLDFLP